jgi:hypothetical protein
MPIFLCLLVIDTILSRSIKSSYHNPTASLPAHFQIVNLFEVKRMCLQVLLKIRDPAPRILHSPGNQLLCIWAEVPKLLDV